VRLSLGEFEQPVTLRAKNAAAIKITVRGKIRMRGIRKQTLCRLPTSRQRAACRLHAY
jgi:hypothetical protein